MARAKHALVLWLALMFFFGGTVVHAQSVVTSTILGTITDPQGATVAGAQIRLLNVDSGREWKAVSGQDGQYVFPDLSGGHYQVDVNYTGFKSTHAYPVVSASPN
jgi:hypothetical protein